MSEYINYEPLKTTREVPGTLITSTAPISLATIELYSPAEHVLAASHSLDPRYIGWESVRNAAGTGFEGYMVGSGANEDAIGRAIASRGETELRRLDISQRKKIQNLLIEGNFNLGTAVHAHRIFGSILAEYRAQMEYNSAAQQFRSKTEELCWTSYIEYPSVGETIEQQYQLPQREVPTVLQPPSPIIENNDGYRFMRELGKVGHPAYRQALQLISIASPGDMLSALRTF